MAFFPNVDPIYLFKRNSGEYLLLEQVLTVKNARVTLKEVPDHLSSFTVKDGTGALLTSVTASPASSTEYQVDYTTGMIHFHSSNEGLSFTFNYSGTGMVNIGANRIIYNTSATNSEDMTAQDILDKQGELDNRIVTIENQITANEIVKQTELADVSKQEMFPTNTSAISIDGMTIGYMVLTRTPVILGTITLD